MLKIKLANLFERENGSVIIGKINTALEKLIMFPFKNAGLQYDVRTRLSKGVEQELKNFGEAHRRILEKYSTETEIEVDGKPVKTKMKIEEKEGKKVETSQFNINEDKFEEVNKEIIELLEHEITVNNCYPLKLSQFEEEDVSGLDFFVLEPFIVDDRT